MTVTAFEVSDNDIVIRIQSGMVETAAPYGQPDGYVEFHNVKWDFSYVYLLGSVNVLWKYTMGAIWYLWQKIDHFQKDRMRISEVL